ncbi:MAG: type II secretion system protein M [Gammaproteobacteria bacterium]|nr:type II secretion system protein M [Gammaproteobacteria bacterium]
MSNPMIENLRSQYLSLGSRDRLAVGVLLVFFGILTFYFAIWHPLHDFKVSSQDELNRQSEMLQGMRDTEKDARASSGNATTAPTGQSLLSQVSRTAQQFGIKPNRLQPEGNDAVSVWFDEVSFNDLIKWLDSQSQSGMSVRQISIDREELPGRVNARIVLRSN